MPASTCIPTRAMGNLGARTRNRQATGNFRTHRHDASLALPALQDIVIASHIAAVVANGFAQQARTYENELHGYP